jgi:hypothetical protein
VEAAPEAPADSDAHEEAWISTPSLHPSPRSTHRDGWEPTLFESTGIDLLHGWLIDPESPEYAAASRMQDYDSAMNRIVKVDVLTRGLFVALLKMAAEQDPAMLDQAVQT